MPHSLFLSRRRTVLRAAAVGLFLAALLWQGHAAPSHAAPVGSGWARAAGLHAAEHFVGQFKDSHGRVAYCTDFERLSPENAMGYEDGHSGGFIRSDGSALNAAQNAALSYLLHRWGATTHDDTAASVQLAVWALTSPGMAWDSPGMNAILRTERLPAGVIEQARSMTSTAFNEAGPYKVKIDLVSAPDGSFSAAVSVLGTRDEPVADLGATATLTGPFALAVKANSSWSTGEQPHLLALKRTGLGSGSLAVSVPRTPAAGVEWLLPSRKDVQRLLVAAVLEPRDAAAALADLPAFQPTVETRTSVARTDAGSTVHDVLTVSSGSGEGDSSDVPFPWLSVPGSGTAVSVEVVSTLWGPLDAKPDRQASVPEGTPRVGTVTTKVDGPGKYNTAGLVVPSPGWYVWSESISPESAHPAEAAQYVLGWQGDFGIAAETTFVPWAPQISTQISAKDALVGDRVTDEVTAAGFGPSSTEAGGTLTLSMYGPLAERPSLSAEIPVSAPLHSATTVPALNGNHTSQQFPAFTAPGCYTVVATYPGDDHTEAFTSAFGEPSETLCVRAADVTEPLEPETIDAPTVPAPDKIAGQTPPSARAELAETGIRAEIAAGAALVLLGLGMAFLQRGTARRPGEVARR